jgi:hypothetical protein
MITGAILPAVLVAALVPVHGQAPAPAPTREIVQVKGDVHFVRAGSHNSSARSRPST